MKKIAILTLNGYVNYGNRLQNLAVQEVLKDLGFYVETIIINTIPKVKNKENITTKKINSLKRLNVKELSNKIQFKAWRYLHKNEIKQLDLNRIELFKIFTRDNIVETDYCISDERLPFDLSAKYDYFVVGSDQVWNPAFNHGSSIYFLTFAPKCKRISFSPSFGISKISAENHENYKIWLNEMASLSVREEVGAEIIKELTGKVASVLVDPTMMLTREQWLYIAKNTSGTLPEKYLLTYFLGGIPGDCKDKIKKIARDNNLEIVNLGDYRYRNTYLTGPGEFINYINSACVFCTDSFHGAVFSILMETPFIVFKRESSTESMFSRIETLLEKFDLKSRKAQDIISNDQVFNIDFTHIPSILDAERKKTWDYLRKALNIRDVTCL